MRRAAAVLLAACLALPAGVVVAEQVKPEPVEQAGWLDFLFSGRPKCKNGWYIMANGRMDRCHRR